jgi:hypothetical protein
MKPRKLCTIVGLVTLLGACESEPRPDSDGPPHDKNTQVRPTHCLYGDPKMDVQPNAVVVTCPDGGTGPTVVCPGGWPSGAKLEDGRVVVECAANDGALPHPSPESPR